MLVSKSYKINSCDDVELDIERESKLEYRISYDDEKELKAIVFVINGAGGNSNIAFLDFNREFIAKKFPVMAVNVFYHCFCCRPSNEEKYNANYAILEQDLPQLKKVASVFGYDSSKLSLENAWSFVNSLEARIIELKNQKVLDENFKASIYLSIIPPNEEYQNYGIMAAIDHINVLKDIVKKFPQLQNLPKIYGGGSYGGYLSLFISKIAPWYVDGVIDNSGSPLPILAYLVGRDMEQAEFYNHTPHFSGNCFLKTFWTRDSNSPYYFAKENYMIRTLLNSSHLKTQAKAKKDIIYISYHSSKDEFDTFKDKQLLFDSYKELGYDVKLNAIYEKDVDGKFIKNLDHGLGISIKNLFAKELPVLLEKLQTKQSLMKANSISYACGDKIFSFKDAKGKFVLFIE